MRKKIFTMMISIVVHTAVIVGLYYTLFNMLLYHGCMK